MEITKKQIESLNQLDRIEYKLSYSHTSIISFVYGFLSISTLILSILSDDIFAKLPLLILTIYYLIKMITSFKKNIRTLNEHFFEIKSRGKK
jgi:hypothetical protein